jgi:hypothetical protein
MSSNNTGYIVLSVLGGVVIALMAGGMYYANSDSNEGYSPTGMSTYQRGGKKTHRRKSYRKKTRKL